MCGILLQIELTKEILFERGGKHIDLVCFDCFLFLPPPLLSILRISPLKLELSVAPNFISVETKFASILVSVNGI